VKTSTRALQLLAAACVALASMPLSAHDFWIEPTRLVPEVGQSVGLRLRVGERLAGDAVPLLATHVQRFVVAVGEAAELQPVASRRGGDPAGSVRIAAPGLHVVGYSSQPSSIELPADKFDAYLRDEGLDAIVAQRAASASSTAPVREHYARCAKALLQVGPANSSQADRRLGLPLELVAERNPYALGPDRRLPLRLTYQGQPLAGALVVAINSLDPMVRQSARSDVEGRVLLSVHTGGMWLVKAVHMVAAARQSGAEWSSLWASLTFEVHNEALSDAQRK
jgi:uncharacterized GH25 family protein